MADITAQFTIYRGQNNSDLKHVATVMRQSNFRDGLQLVKQNPYNGNIFLHPSEVSSIIEFLVPHKPLNNIELTPIVLLFFVSNRVLTTNEFVEFRSLIENYSKNNDSKSSWRKKWATLEDEGFYDVVQPYLDKVKSRITQTSYIQKENAGYGGEYLFTTSFFTSPDSKEDYSVISHNTDILNHHKSKEWKVLKI